MIRNKGFHHDSALRVALGREHVIILFYERRHTEHHASPGSKAVDMEEIKRIHRELKLKKDN